MVTNGAFISGGDTLQASYSYECRLCLMSVLHNRGQQGE